MISFVICQASPEDVQQAVSIDAFAFAPYGTSEPPGIIIRRQQIYPEGFLVAKVDQKVVAYASAERWDAMRTPEIAEDPDLTHSSTGTVFCVTAIAVDPGFQRQGIGSALLADMEELATKSGCEYIVLETSNASQFYLQRGYLVVSQRWHGDTQLWVMRKKLG